MLAVGLVLVAVACSGDDERTDPSVGGVTSVAEETAPGPTTTEDGEIGSTATTGSSPAAEQEPGALSDEAEAELGSVAAPRTGGESLGPLGGTQVVRETDSGTVQIGGGELPRAAAGIPLPEGFELQLATETETASGFSGFVGAPVAEVVEFLRAQLPAAGFDVVSEDSPAATIVLIVIESADASGDIAVSGSPDGEGTTIVVSLSTQT